MERSARFRSLRARRVLRGGRSPSHGVGRQSAALALPDADAGPFAVVRMVCLITATTCCSIASPTSRVFTARKSNGAGPFNDKDAKNAKAGTAGALPGAVIN